MSRRFQRKKRITLKISHDILDHLIFFVCCQQNRIFDINIVIEDILNLNPIDSTFVDIENHFDFMEASFCLKLILHNKCQSENLHIIIWD